MGEATAVFSRGHVSDGVKNGRRTNYGDSERFYSRTFFFFSISSAVPLHGAI